MEKFWTIPEAGLHPMKDYSVNWEQPHMLEPESAERITMFLMHLNCGLTELNEADCPFLIKEAFYNIDRANICIKY